MSTGNAGLSFLMRRTSRMRTPFFSAFLLTISIPLLAAQIPSGDMTPTSENGPTTAADTWNRTAGTQSTGGQEITVNGTDPSGRKAQVVIRYQPSPTLPGPAVSPKTPDCPPEETLLEEEQAAEILWNAFQSIRWDEKPQGDCLEYRKDDPRWKYSPEACLRCLSCRGAYYEERYYYALSPDAEVSILEEVLFSLNRQSVRLPSMVENLLTARMEKAYGLAEEERPRFGFSFTNSWKWWHTKDNSLYLNIFPDEDRLILRIRHHHLQKALAEKRDLTAPETFSRFDTGSPLDLALERVLKSKYPRMSEWLVHRFERSSSGVLSPDSEEVIREIQKALENRKGTPVDLQPAILLACDRIVDRLSARMEEQSTAWLNLKTKLETYGLRFAPDHLGGCWNYDHTLLHTVRKEFPDSYWAAEAFLLLMQNGFSWHICNGGADSFRRVIAEGGDFLKQNLSLEHRLEALFMLAQAYETWWSLSKASDEDEYVRRAEYVDGAEEARTEAIRTYTQVRKTAPDSRYAKIAGWKLPRLRMKLDTGQRRFFCIYD